ncbi:uncharacterized protein JCM10292_006926 [Rhodotorula paludigena]|uniref:uncharacterized protein n=1 Tax=Rhodotorula paludigena TaxID=86838 RepID=UPI003170F740
MLGALRRAGYQRQPSVVDLEDSVPLDAPSDEKLDSDGEPILRSIRMQASTFRPPGGAWDRARHWKTWAVLLGAFLAGLVLGRTGRGGASSGGDGRAGPLSRLTSNDEGSATSTKQLVDLSLPVCERTMLIDWSSFRYGFGSTMVTVARFAKHHNYRVLFSRGQNQYGAYYDHFLPAAQHDCRITEELLQPDTYRKDDGTSERLGAVAQNRQVDVTANRMLVGADAILPTNVYTRRSTFELADLDTLPKLDSQRPKPGPDTTVAEQYPAFDRDKPKARLLLMTAEPDGLDLFRADPLCRRHFDIHELSRGGTDKPFLQSEFRNLPHDERLADTKRMLVQVEVLANFVDTTVVSANSNTGRSLIMLRGGPARTINEYRIRSVDVYWHVGSYLFFMQPPR